ncbi:MAG: hypothetical protein GX369_00340 [Euryarchaeota archaeon]|nr:hypothetical protein [Euryarchaeota archaeon]
MRVAVIICGANSERGIIMERAVELYSGKWLDQVIQFSACTVAASPLILGMSGVRMDRVISVNGCRNCCTDIILKRSDITPYRSVIIDDIIDRPISKCESCTSFIFPDITEEESIGVAVAIERAINETLAD